MEFLFLVVPIVLLIIAISLVVPIILLIIVISLSKKFRKKKPGYDKRGFDHNQVHRNGTKYDDVGFDYYGYDVDGYNQHGYNRAGKNRKGQYDRFFDTKAYAEDGFCNPNRYPIALTTHAKERFRERLGINDSQKMIMLTKEAYRFGKSKRQIKKTSA